MEVNLTKRVMVNGEQRYCPVVWSRNHSLKPHWVTVGEKDEEHAEGSYYIEWRESGRRCRKSVGNDPTWALNKLRTKEAALVGGVAPEAPQGLGNALIADAIGVYLEEIKNHKKHSTLEAYEKSLEYFVESCPKQYLHQITRKDLMNFQTFMRDKKEQSARSVSNKFTNVMTFLRSQKITGLIEKNDRPNYTEEEPEVYEKNDLEKFFAACTPNERMYFQFFLKTGMRDKEVMHLNWNSVDLDGGVVKVRANVDYRFTPKAYKGRTIPIPRDLVEQLREWKKKSNASCPLVFPSAGCKPMQNFWPLCKAVAVRAGLDPKDFWLHKFRATFCTLHLRAGNDLRTVMSYAGHNDIASTMRYLQPNRGEEARKKVEEAFEV